MAATDSTSSPTTNNAASKSTVKKPVNQSTRWDKPPKEKKRSYLKQDRPYNHYNLFYILERELLLQSRGASSSSDIDARFGTLPDPTRTPTILKYTSISSKLPPLPPRYSKLQLPDDWYVHGKNKKRAHKKSHGIATFSEITTTVAENWKAADEKTVQFVKSVADLIMKRRDELRYEEANRAYDDKISGVARGDSSSPGVNEAAGTNANVGAKNKMIPPANSFMEAQMMARHAYEMERERNFMQQFQASRGNYPPPANYFSGQFFPGQQFGNAAAAADGGMPPPQSPSSYQFQMMMMQQQQMHVPPYGHPNGGGMMYPPRQDDAPGMRTLSDLVSMYYPRPY
ncbi:predicted protein [Thalassiosira pseudonana CCMP1335]|uniref:HMG box domain-containing protein n=1 Tax=Thalassiosira pseudonana TaxID=35128 RepID=B8CA44_THAPS|nr:predicted protein [Thalassiosira pseudonana CCMP1335]EED89616.1 predicted protein [Thalassiosira pseudonana CCMP1335]